MPIKLPDHFPKFEIQMPVAVAFASGVCASVLAVVLLVYSFNSGPVRSAGPSAPAEKTTAEQPAAPEPEKSQPSRLVGGAQQQDVSCENQTWPYIDQRCLTPAPPKERVAAKPEVDFLSPNIQARPEAPTPATKSPTPASTDGVASASDRPAAKATEPAWKPAHSALPDRPTAVTGEFTPAEPARNAAGRTTAPKPEQAASLGAAQTSEQTTAPRRKAKEPRRERAVSVKSGDPNRIVRRWREIEYAEPYGGTRKVIVVRPGTLQRDSYFDTAR